MIQVRNNTGVNEPYSITGAGIESNDIDGSPLTGTVPYGGFTTYTYKITTVDEALTFSAGGVDTTISVTEVPDTYTIGVKQNIWK